MIAKKTSKPKLALGRLPDVWWLQVGDAEFVATAEVRRSARGVRSVLVTVTSNTPMVYVPCEVAWWFIGQVFTRTGKLPVWLRSWYWGRHYTRRNNLIHACTATSLRDGVREALEFAVGREEFTEPGKVVAR